MPTHMPDAFEAGTLNLPGIIGLNEGLSYIESQGMENIHNHELALTQAFLEGLQSIDVVNIVGKQDIQIELPLYPSQSIVWTQQVLLTN